jgi:predicted ABC-type ATPase
MGIGRLNIDTREAFTGISDTFDVAGIDFDAFGATEKSTSKSNAYIKYYIQNMNAAKKYTPQMFPEVEELTVARPNLLGPSKDFDETSPQFNNVFLSTAEQFLDSVPELQKQFPEAGFVNRDEIMAFINADIDALEAEQSRIYSQVYPSQRIIGGLMGVAGGALTDPVNVAAMVVAPAPAKWGVAAKMSWDASIAMITEAGIQYNAYQYKEELGREPTFKEALNIVLTTGAGAAMLRGAGHGLVAAYKKAVSSGQIVDTPELRKGMEEHEAAQQLADDILPQNTQEINTHLNVTERAMDNASKGKSITQAEIDDIKLESDGRQQIESINPRNVTVDANQFQFKASGDKAGVTDRLKGVDEWDVDLAGVVVVWERADGKQFIVDGHQRLALANRALDAGQDPEQVLLNARVWKEVDGVTPSDARQRAAIKNIAEGTGTPIDAAKVLRELGADGMSRMSPLPPNSVLVRDAQGLSKLGDDAFKAVINDVVDARYGAIVGDLIADPSEQSAIINALSIHKPSNLNQARIMVQDMKAAGFQRTETEDLFGGQTLTETLFKERARVIDHAMKQVKRDRQTFSVLNEQGGRIESAGNVLNRDENLVRVADGEAAMVALSKLANTKGAVSDAIQQAAERLKSGESIQKASADLFSAIQREAIQKHRTRIDAGEARQANETTREDGLFPVTDIESLPDNIIRPSVIPEDSPELSFRVVKDKKGKLTARVVVDRNLINPDKDNFGYPELGPTIKEGDELLIETNKRYKLNDSYTEERSILHDSIIKKIMDEGVSAKDGEKPLVVLMGGGGASGKGGVLKMLQESDEIPKSGFVHIDPDGIKEVLPEYELILNKKDFRAAMVVHEESSDIANEIIKLSVSGRKNLIVDKTMGNQKKAIQQIEYFKANGYRVELVGVTVDPSEALIRALERYYGSGRLPRVPDMVQAHKGFNAAYSEYAKLVDNARIFDNSGSSAKLIDPSDTQAYNVLERRGLLNEKSKTHTEIQERIIGAQEKNIDAGYDGSDLTGVSRRFGVGREVQGRTSLNDEQQLANSIASDLDDPQLKDMFDEDLTAANELLAANGDGILLPKRVVVNEAGEEIVETQTMREAFDDIEKEQDSLDSLFICLGD